ncbi:MAG TPA: hypothetical protein VFH82_03960 [Gemmatimonadota bacterium]|jgi:hypothetical protein|nr:hypothetical protein [Gemmatimonadota bacterium]
MRGDAATSPRPLYGILLAWGGAALATGAVEALLRTLVPVPLILASLVAAGLLAWRLSAKVRGWVRAVPPRALVALHLVRFVGAWFIVLYRRGELPFAFAVPGGWGDIAAAAGAAGLLFGAFPVRTRGRRAVLRAWNALGLLDILFAVATAARIFLADPDALAPLTRLPLSLLPTYFVPLIVLSHLRIFGWLRETRSEA